MRALITITAVSCTLLMARAAHADAIDGAWCREGLRLTINGPAIVTPAGTRTSGDYSRHAFSYVEAGVTVTMRLLSEEIMQLRPDPQAQMQTWQRCGPPIS